MNPKELKKIIDDHGRWLRNEPGGKRANLHSANLSFANLHSANLSFANLRSANISNTVINKRKIRFLTEAIELGTEIFNIPWDCEEIAKEKNLYIVPGESKAVIALAEDLSGGFCFVHHRKEIWWWAWVCPNPETVTVLWKMEEKANAQSKHRNHD